MKFLIILFAILLFAKNNAQFIEKCDSIACVRSAASIVEKMDSTVDPCDGNKNVKIKTQKKFNESFLKKIFTASHAAHSLRTISRPMKNQL